MIQNDINPSALRQVLDDLGEVLRLVIDHIGDAQRSDTLCLFCRCSHEERAGRVQGDNTVFNGGGEVRVAGDSLSSLPSLTVSWLVHQLKG